MTMISKKWIIPILLPIQIILVSIASKHTEWIEANYSQIFYPKIAQFSRTIFGKFDFSVGDILYILLIINILAFLFKKVRKRRVTWQEFIRKALKVCSIAYFLFHLLWGLNYYRKPLNEQLNIAEEYTTEELEKLTYKLIATSNELHKNLENNDSLAVIYPYSTEEILNKTTEAYDNIKSVFPSLDYTPKSIKTSLISKPLSYMGFGGYINPFTNEAQVNLYIVPYKMPVTSCHEEAHQLGYAKENEANFIGAMTCMHSNDPYFKYAGYTFALRYCLHELHLQDEQKGFCALEKVRPGILANYKQITDFWKAHENPLEPVFKVFYNQFLKVNNQEDGLRSYNYIVALLVNYHKDK